MEPSRRTFSATSPSRERLPASGTPISCSACPPPAPGRRAGGTAHSTSRNPASFLPTPSPPPPGGQGGPHTPPVAIRPLSERLLPRHLAADARLRSALGLLHHPCL